MQQLFGTVPWHAGVGDGLAVFKLVERSRLLVARVEEAFHHDAEDALFAGRDAPCDVFDHFRFTYFVFTAVAVSRVDDQAMFARTGRFGRLKIGERLRHGLRIVVRSVGGAAQYQMAVGVAFGFGGDHASVEVDGQEVMFVCCSEAGIGGRFDRSVGGVLESDRHGHAGSEFAVHLAFGVACANRSPADQIADVLRCDGVEPFGGRRQAEVEHVGEHLACQPHAFTDVELAVEIGVVDQALPSDGGARLFEVDAHDDYQTIVEFVLYGREFLRVFVGRFGVMDGAGADDREDAVVTSVQYVTNLLTGFEHQIAHLVAEGKFLEKISRGGNRIQLSDIDVHGLGKHRVVQQL